MSPSILLFITKLFFSSAILTGSIQGKYEVINIQSKLNDRPVTVSNVFHIQGFQLTIQDSLGGKREGFLFVQRDQERIAFLWQSKAYEGKYGGLLPGTWLVLYGLITKNENGLLFSIKFCADIQPKMRPFPTSFMVESENLIVQLKLQK